jgi:hypothetical protein
VAFNLQSAVDDKHKLIVHNEITNKVDTNALYQVISQAKHLLQADHIDVLADTGYDTGEELKNRLMNSLTHSVVRGLRWAYGAPFPTRFYTGLLFFTNLAIPPIKYI